MTYWNKEDNVDKVGAKVKLFIKPSSMKVGGGFYFWLFFGFILPILSNKLLTTTIIRFSTIPKNRFLIQKKTIRLTIIIQRQGIIKNINI